MADTACNISCSYSSCILFCFYQLLVTSTILLFSIGFGWRRFNQMLNWLLQDGEPAADRGLTLL
jgi:hypothetical protein